MKNNSLKTVITLLLLMITAFVLNFVWEITHGAFLFENHNFDAAFYVPHLAHMAFKDSIIIIAIYLIMVIFSKNLLWIKCMNRKHIISSLFIGLIIAAFIEYRAVYIAELWSYSSHMPLIFGIGLSPLLQLGTTMVLAIWITKRMMFGQ